MIKTSKVQKYHVGRPIERVNMDVLEPLNNTAGDPQNKNYCVSSSI